jgi:hypothetical protein
VINCLFTTPRNAGWPGNMPATILVLSFSLMVVFVGLILIEGRDVDLMLMRYG